MNLIQILLPLPQKEILVIAPLPSEVIARWLETLPMAGNQLTVLLQSFVSLKRLKVSVTFFPPEVLIYQKSNSGLLHSPASAFLDHSDISVFFKHKFQLKMLLFLRCLGFTARWKKYSSSLC